MIIYDEALQGGGQIATSASHPPSRPAGRTCWWLTGGWDSRDRLGGEAVGGGQRGLGRAWPGSLQPQRWADQALSSATLLCGMGIAKRRWSQGWRCVLSEQFGVCLLWGSKEAELRQVVPGFRRPRGRSSVGGQRQDQARCCKPEPRAEWHLGAKGQGPRVLQWNR